MSRHSFRSERIAGIACRSTSSTSTATVTPPTTQHAVDKAASRTEQAQVPSAREAKPTFSWTKQWYPVQAVQNLDPKKPFATKLLGSDLVVWRDATGQWRCFEDRCPHRLAPLSQGRIAEADGNLQCSYHGWRFGGNGKAVSIPQAKMDGPGNEARVCNNKRSCVKAYPTKEFWGLVWVWPDANSSAWADSSNTEPPIDPFVAKLTAEDITLLTGQYFVRDMPIPFDILAENISDQSHVPFGHHGVAGNRESKWATHFKIWDVNKRQTWPDGYTYELEWSPDGINPPIQQAVTCIAPSFISYLQHKDQGAVSGVVFWIVPLDDLNTRVINQGVVTSPIPGPLRWLASKRGRWLDHLLLNEIFDGDLAYLHKAAFLAKQNDATGATWPQDYYLAAQADASAAAWRRWFNGRGQGGHVHASGGEPTKPPAGISRHDLLDRHAQHVTQCPSCQRGLQLVRRSQMVLKGACAAAFLGLAAALGQGQLQLASAPVAEVTVGIGSLLWLCGTLHSFEAKFGFSDYVHSER
ncbi:hypothetical protein WJX73_008202 [Symbiochloris irregularis]|uniref:Rieske domain-containing protein n=1 Tax=Symbiochloris irregularis TaxID=706552 RepID=A0AAW1NMQ4_9CHLO